MDGEEFAFSRGGSTLTTPFAGLYTSASRVDIVEDSIRILFCDFDPNPDDPIQFDKLVLYLETLKIGLMKALEEEEIWIVFHSVTRIVSSETTEKIYDTDHRITKTDYQNRTSGTERP